MKTNSTIRQFILPLIALAVFGLSVQRSWGGSYYSSQTDFNYLRERLAATQNPWNVHAGQGAVILDDGNLGTGPLDPTIQAYRVMLNPIILDIARGSIVRKELFGKRIMRFGGKEFVDKGFGWKQTYGPPVSPPSGPPFMSGLVDEAADDKLQGIWESGNAGVDFGAKFFAKKFAVKRLRPPVGGSHVNLGFPGVSPNEPADGSSNRVNLRRLIDNMVRGQSGEGVSDDDRVIYETPSIAGFNPSVQHEPTPDDNGASGDASSSDEPDLGEKPDDIEVPVQFRIGGDIGEGIEDADAQRSNVYVGLHYSF